MSITAILMISGAIGVYAFLMMSSRTFRDVTTPRRCCCETRCRCL